ncbi:MAG: glycosyl hydrolase, partial [Ilumatobacter sp.]
MSITIPDPATLLVGTRKGLFVLTCDERDDRWTTSEPQFLGHVMQHVVADPRRDGVILAATRT